MFVSERIANLVVAPVGHRQGIRGGLAPEMDDQIDAHIEEPGGAASTARELMPEICALLHLGSRGGLNTKRAVFYAGLVARVRLLGEEIPNFVGPGSVLTT